VFFFGNAESFPTVALLQNNSSSSEGCQGLFIISFGSPGQKKKLLAIVKVILVKN